MRWPLFFEGGLEAGGGDILRWPIFFKILGDMFLELWSSGLPAMLTYHPLFYYNTVLTSSI